MVKNHYIGFISNGKGTLSRGKKHHNKNGKIMNEKYHWLKKKHISSGSTIYKVIRMLTIYKAIRMLKDKSSKNILYSQYVIRIPKAKRYKI